MHTWECARSQFAVTNIQQQWNVIKRETGQNCILSMREALPTKHTDLLCLIMVFYNCTWYFIMTVKNWEDWNQSYLDLFSNTRQSSRWCSQASRRPLCSSSSDQLATYWDILHKLQPWIRRAVNIECAIENATTAALSPVTDNRRPATRETLKILSQPRENEQRKRP